MPTHDARARGRRGVGSASTGGGGDDGGSASVGGRDGRGSGSFHGHDHHHHHHKGGKVSVPKPVNLPSVLKETGTSVSARGAFNSTRTWGGAGAGAGGDGGRTSGTAAGEGASASARSEVALAGATWGRVDGSSAVGANGDGGGAIRVLSRAKEGEDGGTARGESRRRSGDGGDAGGPETRSVEYPSLGDERRANGFGIASDVVEQVRRYMDDDGRAVRRARREDEDERSIGRTPSVETERRGASRGGGGGRSGRPDVPTRRVLTRTRPVERGREESNADARAPTSGLEKNADDASVAADTLNGSRIESERVVDTPGSDLLQSRGSAAPPVVLRRTKRAVTKTAPKPEPEPTAADGGREEKTKKKRGGRRVREREERRVLRASKRDDGPANGDQKNRMMSVPTPSGTSYTEWIGAQYEGVMPAYGMAFSDGSGLFTAYNPGYPMSGAHAYGHAGVQPQPMWTAMSTGHQAPVTVPADAPFDISATGTYGRGSGSTKTMSADVDRIATRLGDLPSSLGEEFGSTDDLPSFASEAAAASHVAAGASAQKPRRRTRKHAT